MAKILYFTAEDQVDELIMIVPDEYDQDQAEKEADDFLTGATVKAEYQIFEDVSIAKYRPFVG